MIPVHLLIEGIYAYREPAEIEFGPLLDAHLFGIFGSVGSGKSSLLEAITFALYGQVERLNKRENVAANIINLEAKKARIVFTFDSTRDQCRYRVTAIGKRGKSASSFDRHAERLEAEGNIPVDLRDIEEAVGLSYEHFTRTVIVPQGKFQEFLMLTDKDRTGMLEELFRLERFDLSAPLARLGGEARTRDTELKAQIGMLMERTVLHEPALAEQIRSLQESTKILAESLTLLEDLLADTRNFLQQQEALEKKRAELEGIRQTLDLLRAEGPAIMQRWNEAEQAHAGSAALREAIHWSELALRARASERSAKALREQALQAELEMAPLHAQLADLGGQLQGLRLRVEELEADLAAPETLQRYREILSRWERDEELLQTLTERGRRIRADRDSEQHDFQERIHTRLAEMGRPADAQDEPVEWLHAAMQVLEARLSREEEELEKLHQQAGLGLLAAALQDGEPCPLCGSAHHPDIHQPGRMSGKLQDLKASLQAGRDRQKRFREIENLLREAATRGEGREAELQRLRAEFKAAQTRQQETLLAIQSEHADAGALRTWLERQHRLDAALRPLRQLRESKALDERRLQERIETHRRAAGQFQEQRVEKEAAASALLSGIPQDWLETWKAHPDEALKALQENHQVQLTALERELDLARQARETHQLARTQGETTLGILQKDLQEKEAEVAVTLQRLRERSGGNTPPPPHELAAGLPALEESFQTKKSELERARVDLGLLEDQLRRFQSDMRQRRLLEDELQRLSVRLGHLNLLERLFRAKGLVQYAATRYLRQIIGHANLRFHRMTRHKLRMELSEDTRAIMVRDYYHGGALRHIKTLSGGQIFQASLALALSLAEYIRQYREGQRDFFFLDEGFGTQDRESLLIVLDTLRALRLENRSVGLISHVEELKQEVGAYLAIHMDPVRGSRVTTNY